MLNSDKKRMPLNINSFAEAVSDYYYVDKTMFIKEILDDGAFVSLFIRPDGFGKSLNMDMLRVFFEKTDEDTSRYFVDTKIWQEDKSYRQHQGKYPVIFLSFSDVQEDSWEAVYSKLCGIIGYEFARHGAELASSLNEYDECLLSEIVSGRASKVRFSSSLFWLSSMLKKAYGERVVIIIDDYDVPFKVAYRFGFYDKLVSFLGGMLSAVLKDNENLAFGLLTGTLRAFKSSIFNGLNNIVAYSFMNNRYAQYFGFTAEEVAAMADYYGAGDKLDEIKKWYGGYHFGDIEAYPVGSLVNYFLDLTFLPYRTYYIDDMPEFQVGLCRDLDSLLKLKELLEGKSVSFSLDTNVSYTDINKNTESFLSFFLMSGYLTVSGLKVIPFGEFYGELCVVNEENKKVLERFILPALKKQLEELLLTET